MKTSPIVEVQTRNFQKLRKRNFQLDERITIVVGESATGKSCFLRSLYWLAFNRPNTKKIITHGKDKCRVKWILKDGTEIVRQRDTKENVYLLDGEKFKAFRTTVPQPVDDVLKVDPINVQKQIQTHFWFILSPSKLGQELNKIVNLDAIDTSLAVVASGLRKAKLEVEITEERLADARDTAKSLRWAGKALAVCQRITTLKSRHTRRRARIARLRSLLSELVRCHRIEKRSEKAITEGQKLLNNVQRVQTDCKRVQQLEELVDILEDCKEASAECLQRIEDKKRQIKKLTKGRCPVCKGKLNEDHCDTLC